VYKDRRVSKDLRESKAQRGYKALLVLALKAFKAFKALLVLELKAFKAFKVLLV
jgi:hypothetical protein